MTHKERQELNELSQKAFGSSSKWKKLVDKGTKEPYERDREVLVPKTNGDLVKKVFTDRKYVLKRFTVSEVRELMTDLLKKREELQVNASVDTAST